MVEDNPKDPLFLFKPNMLHEESHDLLLKANMVHDKVLKKLVSLAIEVIAIKTDPSSQSFSNVLAPFHTTSSIELTNTGKRW